MGPSLRVTGIFVHAHPGNPCRPVISPPSAYPTGTGPGRREPTVLQTAPAQVGLCWLTCGDARGLDRRSCCIPRMSHAPGIGLSRWAISLGSQWRCSVATCGSADLRVYGSVDREKPRLSAVAPPAGHVAGTRGPASSSAALTGLTRSCAVEPAGHGDGGDRFAAEVSVADHVWTPAEIAGLLDSN
jgi:hypothetical protein